MLTTHIESLRKHIEESKNRWQKALFNKIKKLDKIKVISSFWGDTKC